MNRVVPTGAKRRIDFNPWADWFVESKQNKGEKSINVISPDGLPITRRGFKTLAAAEQGLTLWIGRFAAQGYYAAATGERIPLADLRGRCQMTTQTTEDDSDGEIAGSV